MANRKPDDWNSVTVPDRVALRAYACHEVNESGCWISSYSVGSHGYAQVGWQEADERHTVLAHRAAWVHVHGQLPLSVTIDHTCKTRRCVNPEHLRMLPNYENARRIDGRDWPMGQCANGHPNTLRGEHPSRTTKGGEKRTGRLCAACRRLYVARSNWRTRHPGEPFPEHLLLASEKVS